MRKRTLFTPRAERARERAKAWYWANREKRLAYSSEYQKAHPEINRRCYEKKKTTSEWVALQKRVADYYKRNAETIKQRSALWAKENPGKRSTYMFNNKAKRRGAIGKCSNQQWQWRLEFYGHCCAYCGIYLTKPIHRDHVIPVSKGGANWPANLVPACRKCNQRKNANRWTPHQPGPKGRLP